MKLSQFRYTRPCVRLGRGIAAALGTNIITETWDNTIGLVAISEIVSVASELWSILPYFGNIMWMILLFPTIFTVYSDLFWNINSKRQEKELVMLLCFILASIIGIQIDNSNDAI